MGDSEFDPNAEAGKIVKEALDSELVKNLLGPMAQNIGLVLEKVSDIPPAPPGSTGILSLLHGRDG